MPAATQKSKYTHLIKSEAARLGFSHCGIAQAAFLEEEAPLLEQWLNGNMHGEMAYMANYFDQRLDPRKLVEDAKSVISVILNYDTEERQEEGSVYKVSRYAYGRDYHKVLKKKLKALMGFIRDEIGDVNGRAFVDSAPVMDKAWAQRSGLGWIGKHSNLINKASGSFFFIAEIIVDLELDYDMPVADHCGTCTRCIDACPTQAIVAPNVVNGSKCISYLTIELKNNIPSELEGKLDNWIFGCDVCQDVCPWNKFSKPHNEPDFNTRPGLLQMKQKDWEEITAEVFGVLFVGSAVKRTKLEGLKRNIAANKRTGIQ
ncbi:MAG: tRNA epoxyqueuosine(34) reductase QueG [Bacteroidota bacterium]|nr:tRNA epoxyqueuosine(34) reductase QueG [Bacteroidota bacterium]